MAYSTATPPALLVEGGINGKACNIWSYFTTDTPATMDSANYFTNGVSLGMKVGDVILAVNTSTFQVQILVVSAAAADGSVDCNDGLSVAATDTD